MLNFNVLNDLLHKQVIKLFLGVWWKKINEDGQNEKKIVSFVMGNFSGFFPGEKTNMKIVNSFCSKKYSEVVFRCRNLVIKA